ncbi:MAG: TolC family protein [Candidatus Omnitrophota bacterium]
MKLKVRLLFIKLSFVLIILNLFLTGRLYADQMLTWGDCIKEAAKNHPDLIAAGEIIKQSEASKQQTASGLFPQVDAQVSGSTAQSSASAGNSSKADAYGYGVTGSQLLFDGVKTINNVKAAQQNIVASQQSFKFTSTTVRYKLRTAFVNLLTAQEMLRIAQEIFNIRRGNLELIVLRYESGLEHKGALLTAEADLADAQYGIDQNKRAVVVAQQELTKELGRKELISMTVQGDFKVKDEVLVKPDFEALAKKNPSLAQLIAQKNSAEFSLKSAYGNFAPQLTGLAGASKAGDHWTPRGNNWNLGLNLSLPLFEGGLRTAQVAQARALVNQLKENERSALDGIIFTLQQSWALLQDAIENVNVQYLALKATEERSKIAQAQYSIGFIAFDNWIIIEDNLVKAKRSYLNAQEAALLAEAKWIQAKGEVLEYE